MKTFNKISLVVLVCTNCLMVAKAQNSVSLSVGKRDSLISLAKEVVLKFGPDYYREYKPPVIEERKGDGNRPYYRISIPYDPTQETLEWFYAAIVDIWADTFEPFAVLFGCNVGRGIPEGMDWRNDTSIPIQEYQDATRPIYPGLMVIVADSLSGTPEQIKEEYAKTQSSSNPMIVVVIPDSLAGTFEQNEEYAKKQVGLLLKEPVNREELSRKGWERRSNGEWVKTRPDVPPTRRPR